MKLISINKDKIEFYRIGCRYKNVFEFCDKLNINRSGYTKMLERGTMKWETLNNIVRIFNIGKEVNGYTTKPITTITIDELTIK